jgi:hypothetical protein
MPLITSQIYLQLDIKGYKPYKKHKQKTWHSKFQTKTQVTNHNTIKKNTKQYIKKLLTPS